MKKYLCFWISRTYPIQQAGNLASTEDVSINCHENPRGMQGPVNCWLLTLEIELFSFKFPACLHGNIFSPMLYQLFSVGKTDGTAEQVNCEDHLQDKNLGWSKCYAKFWIFWWRQHKAYLWWLSVLPFLCAVKWLFISATAGTKFDNIKSCYKCKIYFTCALLLEWFLLPFLLLSKSSLFELVVEDCVLLFSCSSSGEYDLFLMSEKWQSWHQM